MEKTATTTIEIIHGQRAQSHSDGHSRTKLEGEGSSRMLAPRGRKRMPGAERERKRTTTRNHGLPEGTPEEKKQDRGKTNRQTHTYR
jgi:hypothetical protein